jgi:putative oxidoreductase
MQKAAFFLRIAIAVPYCWFVADRLGFLGPYGHPHVGWGDWTHFMQYARQVMSFVPAAVVPVLAVVATGCELVFGLALLVGCFTRAAAIGSGVLTFLFATAMAISFGIESPLGYSVYTVSAGSFLLGALPGRGLWSVDALIKKSSI